MYTLCYNFFAALLINIIGARVFVPRFQKNDLLHFSNTSMLASPGSADIPTISADGFTSSTFSFGGVSTISAGCGKCGIEAPGGVRLVYWEPDIALPPSNVSLRPNQVYTLASDGFTFTSPSVYVIYSALRATASCGGSALTTMGPSFGQKTIGYSSRFLAYGTLSSPDQRCDENVVVDGFHTIDFTSLYYNPIATSTTTKAGCAPYVNPRLSLPHELTNIDPSWASCEPLFYGAFDPPRVLSKSKALVPSIADPGTVTESPDTAPGPSLAPFPAADHPAPTPKATSKSGVPDVTDTPGQGVPVNQAPGLLPPQHSNAPQLSHPSSAKTRSLGYGNDPAKAFHSQPQQDESLPATQDQTHAQYISLLPNMNPGVIVDNTRKAQPQQAGANGHAALPKQTGVAPSQLGGHQKSEPEPAGSQPQNHANNIAAPVNSDTNVPFVGSPPKFGKQIVHKQANGNIIIGDAIIPEGQSASVSGHEVANNTYNIDIDGTAHNIIPVSAAVGAPVALGTNGNVPPVGPAPLVEGQIVQKQANGNVVVGPTTILEGQTASVDGHQVVNTHSHVIIDGISHAVAPTPEFVKGQSQPAANGNGSTQTHVEGIFNTAGSTTGNIQNGLVPIFDPNSKTTGNLKTGPQQTNTGLSTYPNDSIQPNTANQPHLNPPQSNDSPTNGNLLNSENAIPGTDNPLPNPSLPIAEASNPDSKPPFPIPHAHTSTQHIAQLRIHGLSVHSVLSGGLLIGTQTIPLNARTTIAGVSVSMGGASIGLDGTTYAIATHAKPPSTEPPVIPSTVSQDGLPFTLPIPEEESVNIASLSLKLPGPHLEVLSGGAGVLVMGYLPTATVSGTMARSVETGVAGIRDAIMQTFSPSGSSLVGDGAPVFIILPDQSNLNSVENGTGWPISGINDSTGVQSSDTSGFGTIATGAAKQNTTSTTNGGTIPSVLAIAKGPASKTVGLSRRRFDALLSLPCMVIIGLN